MNLFEKLKTRPCPVCASEEGEADPFLESSFDPSRVNSFSFASRKAPEYMSFRLVRCRTCSTVYAAEAPSPEALEGAYRAAAYDSSEEANFAASTYSAALKSHLGPSTPRGTALEVGTGTGVFLRELKSLGFRNLIGVEPSLAAIGSASSDVRPLIRNDIFREEDFAPGSLSLICCFQTLEHLPDPRSFVQSAYRLLASGGMLAMVTHDYTSFVNRILGRRSPIIDIEHMQIFCPRSLYYLVEHAGFQNVLVEPIRNRYPMSYWLRIAPLPLSLKGMTANILSKLSLNGAPVSLSVGNVLTIGRKS